MNEFVHTHYMNMVHHKESYQTYVYDGHGLYSVPCVPKAQTVLSTMCGHIPCFQIELRFGFDGCMLAMARYTFSLDRRSAFHRYEHIVS